MADLLSAEDLAYMRETQAEARPTEAVYQQVTTVRTPTGGTTTGWGDPQPIDVRLDGTPDEVPEPVAARMDGGSLVKVTLDLVRDVRDGDRITVSATEAYEVITDGDPDRWATAQVIYARRVTWPART